MKFRNLFILVSLFMLNSCNEINKKHNKEYIQVVKENQKFIDTIIRYEITDTSINFILDTSSTFKSWQLELALIDTIIGTSEVIDKYSHDLQGNTIEIQFTNKRVTSIQLFATPGASGELVFSGGELIDPIFYLSNNRGLMVPKLTVSNLPNFIDIINIKKLRSLDRLSQVKIKAKFLKRQDSIAESLRFIK